MKSTRIPDRVHVVRPPENDSYGPSESQSHSLEIVRTLAKISDKLKRSEAERYELLAELREYRKSLRDLEDKSEQSEKAYLGLENKLNSTESSDTETLQRQVRFERALKETEDKMLKSIAGQALIDKRLRDTEDRQTMMDHRLDQSVSEQTKLGRQVELMAQDKARLMRKVERLEEIVSETQDSLRAKAMVLLTDQSQQKSEISMPEWSNVRAEKTNKQPSIVAKENEWKKYINVQSLSTVGLLIAALLLGWSINQMQKREATSASTREVASANIAPTVRNDDLAAPVADSTPQTVSMTSQPAPENVLDYSDEQLLAALENDPEKLASQLNDIEVSSAASASSEAVAQQPAITEPNITPEMENFDSIAFAQDPTIADAVMGEKNNAPLGDRIQQDPNLPPAMKALEAQAFNGNGEAQHDLAAIYTAGHAGVDQNFERAAFWFREASDNGIANARYNLGVLHHQGLGQDRDLSRALYWYREAAKLNHAEAQYNLGIAHIEGIGTEYNPQLAATYFERAANQGIMEAAYNLGLIYDNGLMGQAKPDEALLWYKIAADQGSAEAKSAMEELAKNLQIGMEDVNNLVDRMQIINESVKGRRAGPVKTEQSAPATSSATPMTSDSSLIKQVQEYLMLTGGYPGPADGVNGRETRQAIRAYQASHGLAVNGEISEELLNSMVGGAIERLNQAQ